MVHKVKIFSYLLVFIFLASSFSLTNAFAAVPNYSSNIDQLVDYLKANQDTSGKIVGFGGETSWTIMGMVAVGIDPAGVENGGNSLLDFLANNPPVDNNVTAWERDLLAITAAGKNPFNFGGRNYVAKVESSANSGQIGSTATLNDDIFGILSLISAGPTANQQIISESIDFLIANQNADGGWSWSVGGASDTNDTAVAVQALKAAQQAGFSNAEIANAVGHGVDYLLSLQRPDGGWEYQAGFGSDSASTAWVVQSLIGEDTVVTNGLNFLANLQDNSGGIQYQAGFGSDTFTSSYALSAFAQKAFPIGVFDGDIGEDPDQQIPPANLSEIPKQNNDKEGEVLSASTNESGEVLAEVLPDTGISTNLREIDSVHNDSNSSDSQSQNTLFLAIFGLIMITFGFVIKYLVVRTQENKVN